MLLVQSEVPILQGAHGSLPTKEDIGGEFLKSFEWLQTSEGCQGCITHFKQTNEDTSTWAPKKV